jgi:hypothetical protein
MRIARSAQAVGHRLVEFIYFAPGTPGLQRLGEPSNNHNVTQSQPHHKARLHRLLKNSHAGRAGEELLFGRRAKLRAT